MTIQGKELDRICRELANYFNFEREQIGPCACLGHSCRDFRCSTFWRFLLQDYDVFKYIIDVGITAYFKVLDEYYNAPYFEEIDLSKFFTDLSTKDYGVEIKYDETKQSYVAERKDKK